MSSRLTSHPELCLRNVEGLAISLDRYIKLCWSVGVVCRLVGH